MKSLKIILSILLLSLLSFLSNVSLAQHDHHHMSDSTKQDSKQDSLKMEMPDMNNSSKSEHHGPHVMNMDMAMSHSYSLSLPMNRNGSGTGWLPDASPMEGYMIHSNNWMLMFHGNIFLRYTSANVNNRGKRGASMFDAPNWFMGMAQRKIGTDGLLNFGLMMSLDRLTERGDGYPLLFQSGETWEGRPLVDRQHPHDLFSELSVAYTQRINNDADVTAYFGLPGEPALGTAAFMHRVSSRNNPDAPLSHHWQDATHITFGVATLGARYKIFKIEGSIFSGREPDENRYNFDKPNFDSYSYRISMNPTSTFALQFSQGFIKGPEALEPGVDVTRTTASVIHSYNFTKTRRLNTTIAWGMNDKKNTGDDHKEHSLLLESNFELNRINFYGRYEFVQKDPEELSLTGFDHERKFNINALTLGSNYRIAKLKGVDVSLGAQGSLYFMPEDLEPFYGKSPLSAQVYIRLSPPFMD